MEDVDAVLAACSDREISRWIPFVPWPYTADDARRYVSGCIEAQSRAGPRHPFAIADESTDELLGSIDMTTNTMRTGHVGYWVRAEARGRGVCTHALHRIARFGFGELDLGRLELVTDPDNVASQRVAEKVGFRREGLLRSHLLHRDGRRRDSVMFSLLPGELPQ
jgi:RimJ/RimL family protein N-acetyltransferase